MAIKKVIYTCIIGGYDNLINLSCIKADYDYICFTNDNIKSNFWQIRPLPKETEGLSDIKKQRYVKINAHKVLPEYDFSIYIDGNVNIINDIDKFIEINNIDKKNGYAYIPRHWERDCVYQEYIACIEHKRDTRENMREQIEQYRKEGLPEHFGLMENSIIIRFHKTRKCIKLMKLWWEEFLKQKSNRDQLSLPYILWKNNKLEVIRLQPKLFDSNYFKKARHIKK